jgi:mannose/cellobiose epimerase-like protein (N-acyl-D-glucosamine 2-epimerase family)
MQKGTLFFLLFFTMLTVSCSDDSGYKKDIEPFKSERAYLDTEDIYKSALLLADNWLANGHQFNGFQKTNFTDDWQSINQNSRVNLTSQARLVYVYAIAFELSEDFKYLSAMTSAADFMTTYMYDEQNNVWFNSVDHNGLNSRNKRDAYAYSFVIFALSHAYKVSGDKSYKELALATLKSDIWPGLKYARKFYQTDELGEKDKNKVWYQNPFMHLFEALISLYEVTQYPEVMADIEQIAHLIDEKIIASCGCIPEYLNAFDMSPQYEEKGSAVELGHQIEWAFLLNKAVDIGLDTKYRNNANSLLAYSLKHGVNKNTGGLMETSKLDGEIKNPNYSWWAQAELMRATLYYIEKQNMEELIPIYLKAVSFSQQHFSDNINGGWNSTSLLLKPNSKKPTKKAIGYHAMAYYSLAYSLR